MLEDIAILDYSHSVPIISNQCTLFHTLMGKGIENLDSKVLIKFLMLVARSIHKINTSVIKDQKGIG